MVMVVNMIMNMDIFMIMVIARFMLMVSIVTVIVMVIYLSIFMYKFYNNLLPSVLDSYFLPSKKCTTTIQGSSFRHTYAIPNVRTSYGIFNIKFAGAKFWNSLDAELKTLSVRTFKARLKKKFVSNY